MIYRGKVTAVGTAGVWVLVTELHPTQAFGPLLHAGVLPTVDDMVLVALVGSDETLPDMVVINVPTLTSTDNHVARFDGTGGAIQDSAATLDDTGRMSVPSTSGYGQVQIIGTSGDALTMHVAKGATGNYAYIKAYTRYGEAGQNETHFGLSYDGSWFLSQKVVAGASVSADNVISVRPTGGRVRFSFPGQNGGLELGASGPRVMSGSGSPESAVTAPVGSLWLRTDGGVGTSLYVKESGTGNTGWTAK